MCISEYCVKCGYIDATMEYFGKCSRVVVYENIEIGEMVRVEIKNKIGGNYLQLTCNNCGYQWVEKPLDETDNKSPEAYDD